MPVFGRALLLALLCATSLGVGGCRGTQVFEWERRPGRYDQVGGSGLSALRRAREAVDNGDRDTAFELVNQVFGLVPQNIAVGVLLQELQLELLVERPREGGDGRTPIERRRALARLWRQRAEAEQTAASLVLAARIEEDGLAAQLLLEQALAADPECSWAHYGLAHLAARAGEWGEVSAHLAGALRIDPGQPQARRLQAAMLARAGKIVEAIAALEHWLEQVDGDPRVARSLVASARLDLAQLWLERGDSGRARSALEDQSADRDDERRYLLLLAAVEEADDRPDLALRAAEQAESLQVDDPVALEQQALLFDLWLGDPIAAQSAWQRLLAHAEERPDLASRLRVMRARIELERLAAELEASEQPGFGELVGRPPRERVGEP